MTQVLEPPTSTPAPAEHSVVRFVAGLHAALDRLAGASAWAMSVPEQRDALVELARAQARLEELRLRVLVAADRNEAGLDSGATSTAAWLAHETRTARVPAFGDVHLAHALDEEFDATRQALAEGAINREQAGAIVAAVHALTVEHDDLPPGTHAAAESHLLALAGQHDAVALRRLAKRLFEVVCPGSADETEGRLLAAEEARARRIAYLRLRDNGDGTTEGWFRLPTMHASLLRKALEALTSPRRLGEGRIDPESGRKLTAATLLGHGLMDLIENHLDVGSLPGTAGSPFTVVVTISLDTLRTGLGVAALDTGARISAGEARRMACKAGIIPMVLGGESVPLDLGRERRLFSKHQRIAHQQQYDGCAAANCDRPPAWTESHHLDPWHQGGRTDVRRGIPLCPPHHHMADHPQAWNLRRLPDGSVRFSRRT